MIGEKYRADINCRIEYKKPTATIQKTGLMSFSKDAVDMLHIQDGTMLNIISDTNTKSILYIVVTHKKDEFSFFVKRSGRYYRILTAGLFNHLGYSYKKHFVSFDITRFEYGDSSVGGKCYKLVKKQSNREGGTK